MTYKGIDGKLVEFIQTEAASGGYEIVDIATRGGKGSFVEITLDKDGGITLDDCSAFNSRIRSWMEENGLDDKNMTLDVCSPGLDRELKSEAEYNWAEGKEVIVHTYEPVDEAKEFKGKLTRVDADDVDVEVEGGKPVNIKRKNISKAKLNEQ